MSNFEQTTDIYLNCNNDNNQILFSQTPICYSGNIVSGSTINFILVIPQIIAFNCKLYNIDTDSTITVDIYDKETTNFIAGGTFSSSSISNYMVRWELQASATDEIITNNFYAIINGILINDVLCSNCNNCCETNICACLIINQIIYNIKLLLLFIIYNK
jgi:hypothetical protein